MFWNVDGRRDVVPNVGSSRNCPQARRRDLFCALAISFFFFFFYFRVATPNLAKPFRMKRSRIRGFRKTESILEIAPNRPTV